MTAPERPANAVSRPQSAEEGESGVSGQTGDGERRAGAEGEWRERLAAALYEHRKQHALQIDGVTGEDVIPLLLRVLRGESAAFADALLPTVRQIVAGELRALADEEFRNGSSLASFRLNARADVLDSTDHGKA